MSALLLNATLFSALIGYYVTWINNRAAALSANAFDLAEWVGIVPAVRYAQPPLSAPFALRAALVCLAWLFALRGALAQRLAVRVAMSILGLALALSLRPPIAFFRGETGDPNYQQLAALCLVATSGVLLIGAATWRGMARGWWLWLSLLLTLIGAASAVLGLIGALEALARLKIPTPLGAGVFLFVISIGAHGAAGLWLLLRRQRLFLGRDLLLGR
jgi:hypothetical protein